MTQRTILARVAIGILAYIVGGCSTPSPSTQAPVPQEQAVQTSRASQALAPSADYRVMVGDMDNTGSSGSVCEQEYYACINRGWRGYWFFRARRCRRDYYRCINYGEH